MKKISLLFLLIFILSIGSCKRTPPDFRGKIIFTSGKVSVDKERASVNQIIPEGSTIVTGPNSVCDIIFNEKNIIRIDPGSTVEFTLTDKESKINVTKGTVMSVLYKLLKSEKGGFEITTPTAVASIRGTSFYLKVESPKKTYICDCNGIIEIKDTEGNNLKTLKASSHKAIQLTKDKEEVAVSDSHMLYHVNGTLNKIAKKIKVEIDWTEIHGD